MSGAIGDGVLAMWGRVSILPMGSGRRREALLSRTARAKFIAPYRIVSSWPLLKPTIMRRKTTFFTFRGCFESRHHDTEATGNGISPGVWGMMVQQVWFSPKTPRVHLSMPQLLRRRRYVRVLLIHRRFVDCRC